MEWLASSRMGKSALVPCRGIQLPQCTCKVVIGFFVRISQMQKMIHVRTTMSIVCRVQPYSVLVSKLKFKDGQKYHSIRVDNTIAP